MIGILCGSIVAAVTLEVLLRLFGGKNTAARGNEDGNGTNGDGASKREAEQRGLKGLWLLKLFEK